MPPTNLTYIARILDNRHHNTHTCWSGILGSQLSPVNLMMQSITMGVVTTAGRYIVTTPKDGVVNGYTFTVLPCIGGLGIKAGFDVPETPNLSTWPPRAHSC